MQINHYNAPFAIIRDSRFYFFSGLFVSVVGSFHSESRVISISAVTALIAAANLLSRRARGATSWTFYTAGIGTGILLTEVVKLSLNQNSYFPDKIKEQFCKHIPIRLICS